ncbi:lama1 [Trichonephila clavipes]|nr:lama1 [Trichonephila clavipes]
MKIGDEKWVTYDNIVRKRSWSKSGEAVQTVVKPGLTAKKSAWRNYENPEARVTRTLLMLILQNVQHILIRATEGADVKIARLKDVSMEIAVPLSPTPASPYVAVGVEMCKCPKEYGGLSCQDNAVCSTYNRINDLEHIFLTCE